VKKYGSSARCGEGRADVSGGSDTRAMSRGSRTNQQCEKHMPATIVEPEPGASIGTAAATALVTVTEPPSRGSMRSSLAGGTPTTTRSIRDRLNVHPDTRVCLPALFPVNCTHVLVRKFASNVRPES